MRSAFIEGTVEPMRMDVTDNNFQDLATTPMEEGTPIRQLEGVVEPISRCKRPCEDRFAMVEYSPRKMSRQKGGALSVISSPVVVHASDQMKIREKCILLGRTRLVFPKVDLRKLG